MASNPNTGSSDQHKDEIRRAYEETKKRNAEFKEIIDYLEKENLQYKQVFDEHKRRLTNLNNFLEKSAKLFVELLDNTNSALQIGRLPLIHSAISPSKSATLQNASPEPGSSGKPSTGAVASVRCGEVASGIRTRRRPQLWSSHVHGEQVNSPKVKPQVCPSTSGSNEGQVRNVTRRKLHIEPLNLQKLREMSGVEEEEEEEEETENSNDTSTQQRFLSTIYEENLSRMKEVSVRLTRLSESVMAQHLKKLKSPLCSSSFFNSNDSFTSSKPTFSSTPNKLTLMTQLGLTSTQPKTSSQLHNFVNTRKRGSSNQSTKKTSPIASSRPGSLKMSEISPKKERQSFPLDGDVLSPKKESLRNSRKRVRPAPVAPKTRSPTSTEVEAERTKRPSRSAKPTNALKEQSLRTKLRRT